MGIMSVVSGLWKQRQEEFKANLNYIVKPCLYKLNN